MPISQNNSPNGMSSLQTIKYKVKGFTKSVLQEYVVIFCKLQTEPYLSNKAIFPRGMQRWEREIRNPQFNCAGLMSPGCLSSFKGLTIGVVYLFPASPCMSSLLRCGLPFPCLTLHVWSTQVWCTFSLPHPACLVYSGAAGSRIRKSSFYRR